MTKTKAKSANRVIEVDIVSDFVCPWCWLGYKLFLKGAAQSKAQINVSWRPYMLDPAVPEGGTEYKAYMKNKFGDTPDNKFKAMRDILEDKGPALGIKYDFGAIKRRPNTLNAHRLMRWAQGQDIGQDCADELFIAFMEKGGDIGDVNALCDIAGKIGMDVDIIRELFAGDQDKIDVQNEIMFFRGLGISGVPTFIYNGQFAVQGAQDPAAHVNVIKQALAAPNPTA
ncbi:MAG: DsbA family oxidoreductase [Litorimonas sp.]